MLTAWHLLELGLPVNKVEAFTSLGSDGIVKVVGEGRYTDFC